MGIRAAGDDYDGFKSDVGVDVGVVNAIDI